MIAEGAEETDVRAPAASAAAVAIASVDPTDVPAAAEAEKNATVKAAAAESQTGETRKTPAIARVREKTALRQRRGLLRERKLRSRNLLILSRLRSIRSDQRNLNRLGAP